MGMQQTLQPDSKKSATGLVLAVATFLCIFLILSRPVSAQSVLESVQFSSKWPETPADILKVADGTLFFAAGNVLILLDAENFNEKGRISLDAPRGIQGIAVNSAAEVVYVACGRAGLMVVDISGASPVLSKTLVEDDEGDPVQATAVDLGSMRALLYVADKFFGMHTIDISTPKDPDYLSGYKEETQYPNEEGDETTRSGGYINICVRETEQHQLAFILDLYLGLRILDISNISNPVEKDQFDMRSSLYFGQLSEVKDLTADESYVYVSDAAYGVAILDYFSDPTEPGKISIAKEGQIKSPGTARGLWFSADDDTLFLADSDAGLLIADMSSPTAAPYDQTEDPVYPESLVNSESYAATGAYAVTENAGMVYLANAENGLAKLQRTGALDYQETGIFFDPPADVTSIVVEEGYAYALDNDNEAEGLRIIDIADTETGSLSLSGFVVTLGNASAVAVHEAFAWVADASAGVACIDITDPESPELLENQSFDYPADARDIKIMEDEGGSIYAFIADPGGTDPGLIIAEAGSQGGLTYIKSFPIDGARAVALSEELNNEGEVAARYALVAGTTGMTVVDVSDPDNPVGIIGDLDTSGNSGQALDVAAKPPYAIVAHGAGGVLLVNLSDPGNPGLIDSFDAEGTAVALFIQQSYVHTAVGERGLLVLGISDTEPASLDAIDIDPDEDEDSPYYNTPGMAMDVAVAGEDNNRYTYIADFHGGFRALLQSDRIGGGINEQPFDESSDDTGCFIEVLGIGY